MASALRETGSQDGDLVDALLGAAWLVGSDACAQTDAEGTAKRSIVRIARRVAIGARDDSAAARGRVLNPPAQQAFIRRVASVGDVALARAVVLAVAHAVHPD